MSNAACHAVTVCVGCQQINSCSRSLMWLRRSTSSQIRRTGMGCADRCHMHVICQCHHICMCRYQQPQPPSAERRSYIRGCSGSIYRSVGADGPPRARQTARVRPSPAAREKSNFGAAGVPPSSAEHCRHVASHARKTGRIRHAADRIILSAGSVRTHKNLHMIKGGAVAIL